MNISSAAWIIAAATAAAALSAGCARFEYRVIEPANFAQTITEHESRIPYPPLEYRLSEIEDLLAIAIINPTNQPVWLLGDKSYVVDPKGESHPLPPATIAPNSFIHFVFPPVPRVYRLGPRVGFGFGFGMGHGFYHHHHTPFGYGFGYHDPFFHPFYYPFYDPFYSPPVYYQVYDPRTHWEWTTGPVRLSLTYEIAPPGTNQPVEHRFIFERRRVKN